MPSKLPNDGPSSRLAAAANELLEAAGIETTSMQQMKISSDLLAFKQSVDSKMDKIELKISTVNQTMDSKLNTLNQRIANVENSVASLEKCFSAQAKLQNIAFAIENSHLQSFGYYSKENNRYCNSKKDSKDIVKTILLAFRKGFGSYLPFGAIIEQSYNEEMLEASKKDFQNKLVDQIHGLIGTKPRIELD